jgi:hypothetical protein
MTVFDERVVPHFYYSRDIIARAMALRRGGRRWEEVAGACTATGDVDVSVVKRWCRRFTTNPPATLFRFSPATAMVGFPDRSRSPDPLQEDPWARSPPSQP